jgi:hypothetical protein
MPCWGVVLAVVEFIITTLPKAAPIVGFGKQHEAALADPNVVLV